MLTQLPRRPAVVSRAPSGPLQPIEYLRLATPERVDWTQDLASATAFASMREAARAALRLPSSLRAFSLPLQAELKTREDLH